MMKHYSRFVISYSLFVLLFSGCGQQNPDGRETVTGTITLNGQPLDCTGGAMIAFTPIETGGGTGAVKDGKFALTMQDAVKPGKYIVRFEAVELYNGATGKPAPPEEIPAMMSVNVNILPPEFGEKSTIEFEVVKGQKNVFNYDIKTDFKPDASKIRPKGGKNAAANMK